MKNLSTSFMKNLHPFHSLSTHIWKINLNTDLRSKCVFYSVDLYLKIDVYILLGRILCLLRIQFQVQRLAKILINFDELRKLN